MHRLIWNGKPGDVKVNHRFVPTLRGGRAVLVKSRTYREGVASMAEAFREQWGGPPLDAPTTVKVSTFLYRCHRSGPAIGLPTIDVDAVLKATLDALEAAGVVRDDSQIRALMAVKSVAAERSTERIEVFLDPDMGPQVETLDPHGGMAQAGGR